MDSDDVEEKTIQPPGKINPRENFQLSCQTLPRVHQAVLFVVGDVDVLRLARITVLELRCRLKQALGS
jgi:hypothetical protein